MNWHKQLNGRLPTDRFRTCENINRTIQHSELLQGLKAFICLGIVVWLIFYTPVSDFTVFPVYIFIIMLGGVVWYLTYSSGTVFLTNTERRKLYNDILFRLPLDSQLTEKDKLELKRLKIKNYYK